MKWNNISMNYQNQVEKLRSQNPYERLGITYGATMDEVKKAYRRKIRLYHPDKTDNFMSEHGQELSKLLNQAVDQIKKELER
jgi:curved DNA-binding protein CbpA